MRVGYSPYYEVFLGWLKFTLSLITTYNVLNLESVSYTGFWGLTPSKFFDVELQWDRKARICPVLGGK